jgi:hypothetical protein
MLNTFGLKPALANSMCLEFDLIAPFRYYIELLYIWREQFPVESRLKSSIDNKRAFKYFTRLD